MKLGTRSKGLLAACLALGLCAGGRAAEYYAAPNGNPSSSGSISAPWDLQSAFNNASPGDTVWLRGGSYNGSFTCNASGNSSSPIIYRQYAGERARVVGGSTQSPTLLLQCHNVWLWGFEIYSADPVRVSSQSTTYPTDIQRGPSIEGSPDGANCKLINMVLHDDFNPFFGDTAAGLEIYGSLSFFNGWDAPDRGHGHSLYLQNSGATKAIYDNILFDNFAEGIQVYSQGGPSMNNLDIENNVIVNAGYPSQTTGYTTNLIVGGSSIAPTNIKVINNFTYHDPNGPSQKSDSRAFWLGSSGGGCQNATVTNNYFVDVPGQPAMTLKSGCAPAMTGNTFVGTLVGFSESQYPNNSYYAAAPVAGSNVFVMPNKYESGRANIVIYNWSQAGAVSANLASVLKTGDQYLIQDAQDFYGSPVAQGIYAGGAVSIPMTHTTMTAMVGSAPVTPEHTSREFGVFVLMRTSGSSSPAPTPPPSPAPGPQSPLADGVYSMTNLASKLALDDPGSSTASGVQIIQYGFHGAANQRWKFAWNGNGYYTIQNQASGLYLSDPNGSKTPATQLQQQTAGSPDTQLWSLSKSGSAWVIRSKASGLVIDDPGASSQARTGMILYPANGGGNQSWSVQ